MIASPRLSRFAVRWIVGFSSCIAGAAASPAIVAQQEEPLPSLLGRTSKPTYGDELNSQQQKNESVDAVLEAQGTERLARFATIPDSAPAAVRKAYEAQLAEVRDAIIAVRRQFTTYEMSATIDEEAPRRWSEAVQRADSAVGDWIAQMAQLYAGNPHLYQNLGLTLMEIVRTEAALDRTEHLLPPSRALFEQPPGRLDAPLLLQIGYVGYTQGDYELAKSAWDQYKATATLTAEFEAFYQSIDTTRSLWERELREREADKQRDNPIVVLETNKGLLTIELFEDQAPNAVASFMYLIEHDYYKSMRLFRVIPNYCIQTGCINGDGSGNAGYQIAGENQRPDRRDIFRGSLMFALGVNPETGQPVPDTASSQFLIATTPLPVLNEPGTVFGRVIDGTFLLGTFNKIDLADEEQQKDPSRRADVLIDTEVIKKRDHEYRPEPLRGQLPF